MPRRVYPAFYWDIEGSALYFRFKFRKRPAQERGKNVSVYQKQCRPWVRPDAGGQDREKI